ncbi:MAG: phage terminase large subunit [Chlorobiaceae bacterium]
MSDELERAVGVLEAKRLARIWSARESFREYRKLIAPTLKDGWFRQSIECDMQQFWDDFEAGKRPKLILTTPPQMGKSILVIDFLSWMAGKNPDHKVIFASFSDRLGVRANLRLQRIIESPIYRRIFPETRLNGMDGDTTGRYLRNKDVLEYVDRQGYFRNTTAGGPITGESLDLGLIDDPTKGREEANSPTMREKTWLWYTDDFSTRFSEAGALLIIMTRWHVDDLAGRIIEADPGITVRTYKAIAEEDEPGRRLQGEPLFPELKSLEFLEDRKRQMRLTSWTSLYQASPIIDEGDMFRPDQIKLIDVMPANIKHSVRYWDKAGTDAGGAYTAGVLMHTTTDDMVVIADVVRGQWSAGRREDVIRQTAEMDGKGVSVWVEQEPGSGGKESAENTIRNLMGYTVKAEAVTGSKTTRSEPFAAYVEAGRVMMRRKPWNREYLEEMRLFPNGKYKDQVDASSGAYNKLTLGKSTLGVWQMYANDVAAKRAAEAGE